MIETLLAFITVKATVIVNIMVGLAALLLLAWQRGRSSVKKALLEKNASALKTGQNIQNEINSLSSDDPKRSSLRKKWTRD